MSTVKPSPVASGDTMQNTVKILDGSIELRYALSSDVTFRVHKFDRNL